MAYPPEFLKRVDQFIDLANQISKGGKGGKGGEASAAILFAAGRYNAFNYLSTTPGGTPEDQAKAVEFYVSEYRKALLANLAGQVGPVLGDA